MFQAFKQFVSELAGGDKHPSRFEEGDYRLAAAALLVHACSIDGNMSDVERAKLQALLKHEAIDLYHFTSLLNRSLDEAGRRRMVEMLWQVVYADRRVTEFEENLIWRAADLLGVSSRERIELRQQVAASRGGEGA